MAVPPKSPTSKLNFCSSCRGNTCSVCGVGIFRTAKTCEKHRPIRLGKNSPNWKGGHVNKCGYRVVVARHHPNAVGRNFLILEHRLVMSNHLGRPLIKGETVHHKNGKRADNRIENLELWISQHPKGQKVKDVVRWAKEMLRLYEPEALTQEAR